LNVSAVPLKKRPHPVNNFLNLCPVQHTNLLPVRCSLLLS
jgi:hypothetical protein